MERVRSGVCLAKCKAVVQGSTQIRLEVGDGRQDVRARSQQFMRHKRGMNDPWLRLLYTSLELIRSSRVLAAGSAHNVLSMVTYRRIEAFRLV